MGAPAPKVKLDIKGVTFSATFGEGTKNTAFPLTKSSNGKECELYSTKGKCNNQNSGRCGISSNGELYAWLYDAAAACSLQGSGLSSSCGFKMGPPVRKGCSRVSIAAPLSDRRSASRLLIYSSFQH